MNDLLHLDRFPLFVIAGPCVIESAELCLAIRKKFPRSVFFAGKLLFENDRVKVWEMALEPGEEGAVHRHELDYVMVQVDGDRMAGVSEPDSEGPYPGYIEGDVSPGNVLSAKRGGIETARNVGKKAFYEIIVELKD